MFYDKYLMINDDMTRIERRPLGYEPTSLAELSLTDHGCCKYVTVLSCNSASLPNTEDSFSSHKIAPPRSKQTDQADSQTMTSSSSHGLNRHDQDSQRVSLIWTKNLDNANNFLSSHFTFWSERVSQRFRHSITMTCSGSPKSFLASTSPS